LAKDLDKDIALLVSKIYELAGEEFNIASPKQLGIVLFEKMKLVDNQKKLKQDNTLPLKMFSLT
jgi:DNA polymerase-1